MHVSSGALRVENGGVAFSVTGNELALINCHVPHAYRSMEENTVVEWIHFDGANTDRFWQMLLQQNQMVYRFSGSDSVHDRFETLMDLCGKHDILPESRVSQLLHGILCDMLLTSGNTSSGNPEAQSSVTEAKAFIRAHYSEQITINDIARRINLSCFHFCRVFKQSSGYTPHEYLTIYRINQAKQLLKSTDLPISEIAMRVGYLYATSFNSIFSKRVGMPPRAYRDSAV